MDRYSPVAPSHVRVLVLPVGRVDRTRFVHFLTRLQKEAAFVQLADLPSDEDANARLSTLSPKTFPNGSILFNYSTVDQIDQHHQLSPFELFREPLLVLGVAHLDGVTPEDAEKELKEATQYLRERHPRVVHRQLLALNEPASESNVHHGNVISIAEPFRDGDGALKKAVHELASRFLAELATYTKAMQASPSIQTPGQTSRSLQTQPVREKSRQIGAGLPSGRHTPSGSEVSSPTSDNSPSRPPSRGFGSPPPATSFNQMQHVTSASGGLGRSDSRASSKSQSENRAETQDRVSVQGFGSNTSQEKARNRGKARVGIVIGHIHLMAGQWNEALRILIEHTTRSRALADHLWHAKGMEGICNCLLLIAWAGLEFLIPSLLLQSDRTNTSGHRKRDSQNGETPARKFANILPEVFKSIMNLYLAGDGSLELPPVIISEAAIRFSKTLAIIRRYNGQLHGTSLAHIVQDKIIPANGSGDDLSISLISRSAVADMLSLAQPVSDDTLTLADHISILAGISSVYSILQMNRKKAITVRAMVAKLTAALNRARKLGAAEMGIHPAASLSAETGAGTILAVVEESGGINDLISQIIDIYGAEMMSPLPPTSHTPAPKDLSHGSTSEVHFGNDALKESIMRDMVAFCEASPDPYGVLRLTASLLKSARPCAAVDTEPEFSNSPIEEQEHLRLAAIISRTIGVSKTLGLPDVQATYWDPFLVRGIEFKPAKATQKVILRSKLKTAVPSADDRIPGNPLLYDPNTSRPGTAITPEKLLLVAAESVECTIELQNPFDMPVEIERMVLVAEGTEFATSYRPCTLGPRRIQRIPLSVSPDNVGESRITGCRIKIFGCHEQIFYIVEKPWTDRPTLLVKDHGQNGRRPIKGVRGSGITYPETSQIAAKIIGKQPILVFESVSLLESSLMLLEGESQCFGITLRNTSSITASVFEAVGTKNVLGLADEMASPVNIAPGETATLKFEAVGTAGVSEIQADFYYCSTADGANTSEYVRMLSVPLNLTVNAALRFQHFDVLPTDSSATFMLCFDIGNAWPKPLTYSCEVASAEKPEADDDDFCTENGTLGPGEVARVHVKIKRWSSLADCDKKEVCRQLADHLRVSWTCENRTGEMDLSNMSLPTEAIALVQGPPVQVDLHILSMAKQKSSTRSFAGAKIGSFMTVRANLTNRITTPTSPLFIQLHTRTADGALYNDRHIAVAGAQHRILPPLDGWCKDKIVDFVTCPLMAGVVELKVTVTPIGTASAPSGSWVSADSLMINVE
ncbi:transport protein particle subunit [Acrodontium crateriforme]|uniref:Transport protein particle subunit n=1 Tax=Acrodontium crateriforme TaxID=150365 RepID=A0AAQ3RE02_9PEZI|nr:transport protein particle subunit [Acrodontium crateriforme]